MSPSIRSSRRKNWSGITIRLDCRRSTPKGFCRRCAGYVRHNMRLRGAFKCYGKQRHSDLGNGIQEFCSSLHLSIRWGCPTADCENLFNPAALNLRTNRIRGWRYRVISLPMVVMLVSKPAITSPMTPPRRTIIAGPNHSKMAYSARRLRVCSSRPARWTRGASRRTSRRCWPDGCSRAYPCSVEALGRPQRRPG